VDTDVRDKALCLGCNYPLRDLDTRRCPECGRAFDPDDPTTFNPGRPLDALARAVLAPSGTLARAIMWSLAALGVLGPAWLAPSNMTATLWLLLWGGFVFACWYRSGLRVAVIRNHGLPQTFLHVDRRFRRQTRVVFAIVAVLVITRAPFVLALWLSRPSLDPLARNIFTELPADVQPPIRPGLRGLVMVRRVDATTTTVTFQLVGGGWIQYRMAPDGQTVETEWETWLDHW
jgi:hypothetical protein